MNTRKEAEAALAEFMDSNEKVALLTGTNEYRKRVLALETFVKQEAGLNILFRANYIDNFQVFYAHFDIKFKVGKPYRLENHTLYIDTIRENSWDKSPLEVDHAVLYPLEGASLLKERARLKLMDDLLRRVSGKIILVDHGSTGENAWLSDFVDRRVSYDEEEGDPVFSQLKKEFDMDYMDQ